MSNASEERTSQRTVITPREEKEKYEGIITKVGEKMKSLEEGKERIEGELEPLKQRNNQWKDLVKDGEWEDIIEEIEIKIEELEDRKKKIEGELEKCISDRNYYDEAENKEPWKEIIEEKCQKCEELKKEKAETEGELENLTSFKDELDEIMDRKRKTKREIEKMEFLEKDLISLKNEIELLNPSIGQE